MPAWVVRALSAARRVPWTKVIAALTWLLTTGREYWDLLTPAERREFLALARKWRGRRANLTQREQTRFDTIVKKLRNGPPKKRGK